MKSKSVPYEGSKLLFDGKSVVMPYAVRDAFLLGDRIIVLLDPDSYLNDPSYGKERRRGNNPLRNLLALSRDGKTLWEAEFPEAVDHYYLICSRRPLRVNSFSSYQCEIDSRTGRILKKVFFK